MATSMASDDTRFQPPATMPGELSVAIDQLSASRRHIAVHGWDIIGAKGRQHYTDVIYRAMFDWTSRLRCRYVISRLIKAATTKP